MDSTDKLGVCIVGGRGKKEPEATVFVPQVWADASGDEAAKEALRPIYSLASVLQEYAENSVPDCPLDSKNVGCILRSLVERAEMLLDIPDGSVI